MTLKIGMTPKRQCLEKIEIRERAPLELKTEELSRKKFFQEFCLAKSSLEAPRNVCVVVSNFLNDVEKDAMKLLIPATLQKWHSNCQVLIAWADIPKEAFFTREYFKKMKKSIDEIPTCLKVYLLADRILVSPLSYQKRRVKQVNEDETPPDKMIFVNLSNDPKGKLIAEVIARTCSKIPHYYLTSRSSQEPLRKLTKHSLVYFFEKNEWVLQSPKLLNARGFRVVDSFPKKQASGNCSGKKRVL